MIEKEYKQTPLYAAFTSMCACSEHFFGESCKFDPGWGWKGYVDDANKKVRRIQKISFDENGQPKCPILYIGESGDLQVRMCQLMNLREHPASHPIWALLFGGWSLEIAVRATLDHKNEERRLKELYRAAHGGDLPPLMEQ